MKGPSPFSTDQYASLLCLWGIKSLKHKGFFFFFCIKIQTMVHKTFFFPPSLSCFMHLYFLSFTFVFGLPFNFPLLKKQDQGLFNEAVSKGLQEANNQKVTVISVGARFFAGWQNVLLRLLICKDSLAHSQILLNVNRRHGSARRASCVGINKRMDSQILCNSPLILHNKDGSI